jgi:hypothetical protein
MLGRGWKIETTVKCPAIWAVMVLQILFKILFNKFIQ